VQRPGLEFRRMISKLDCAPACLVSDLAILIASSLPLLVPADTVAALGLASHPPSRPPRPWRNRATSRMRLGDSTSLRAGIARVLF